MQAHHDRGLLHAITYRSAGCRICCCALTGSDLPCSHAVRYDMQASSGLCLERHAYVMGALFRNAPQPYLQAIGLHAVGVCQGGHRRIPKGPREFGGYAAEL